MLFQKYYAIHICIELLRMDFAQVDCMKFTFS